MALTHATNPTEWPYGGEPDSSKPEDFLKSPYLIFKQAANFNGLTFSKEVDFTESKFLQQSYFLRSQFLNEVYFRNTLFSKIASFRNSRFSNIADFNGAKFEKQADFSSSQFSKYACFRNTQFSNMANFSDAQFFYMTDFKRCEFSGAVVFSRSKFSGEVNFSETEFLGEAYFGGSEFLGRINFSHSHFSKAMDLGGSIFLGKIDLENASLDDNLIIAGTRFEKGLDFRRTNLSKAKIFFDHHTFFPSGTLNVNWSQLKKRLYIATTSCPSYGYIQLFEDVDIKNIPLIEHPDSLNQAFEKEKYDLTEIFYHRLRDNYLTQSDRSSADAVMYELASKRSEFLKEPHWVLYGWFMGWGYKPLRFALTVFLLVIPFFAFIWYKFFYHRVAPIVDRSLNKGQKCQLEDVSRLKPYDHRLAAYEANYFARLWHVMYFSTSVLLSIRFKKEWIERDDQAFLTWVTIEWTLGIVTYALFIALVKSYEFGYVKGLLGF